MCINECQAEAMGKHLSLKGVLKEKTWDLTHCIIKDLIASLFLIGS
jgi:hypothetical protein